MVLLNNKHLSEPWFSLVAIGAKKVEGKLLSETWSKLREGDIIEWYNEDLGWKRTVRTKIVSIECYVDFQNYLRMEGLANTLPGIETIQDGIRVYDKYFSLEDQSKYGVAALHLERVSKY